MLMARHVLNRVIQDGSFTPTGRQRGALRTYLQIVDRRHRLAVLLGLDRRERNVGDGTIQDWIAAQRLREAREEPVRSPSEGQDDAGH